MTRCMVRWIQKKKSFTYTVFWSCVCIIGVAMASMTEDIKHDFFRKLILYRFYLFVLFVLLFYMKHFLYIDHIFVLLPPSVHSLLKNLWRLCCVARPPLIPTSPLPTQGSNPFTFFVLLKVIGSIDIFRVPRCFHQIKHFASPWFGCQPDFIGGGFVLPPPIMATGYLCQFFQWVGFGSKNISFFKPQAVETNSGRGQIHIVRSQICTLRHVEKVLDTTGTT